jgi:para-nitrobenzyl esterase
MFMYGGANLLGASDMMVLSNLYDGQALASSQNAVVVTFNYRLGALGFLAHPALSADSPVNASGNYGLLDGILALHWVQDNIGAFGGDASRVLFFGESAGAFNACAILASPLARGLFSAVLMESGACNASPQTAAYATGATFAQAVGCDGAPDVAACLRDASASAIVAATPSFTTLVTDPASTIAGAGMPFKATVDGYVLSDTPEHILQQGKQNPAAFLAGTNEKEGALFVVPGVVNSCADFSNMIQTASPAHAAAILQQYPCSVLDPSAAAIQLVTDLFFACPTRRALRAAAAANFGPVYRYYYRHTYDYGALAAVGPTHATELPFVFNSFGALGYIPTPAESALSATMEGYWVNFAAAANPNAAAAPLWPSYDPTQDNAIVLDDTISATSGIETANCDFWDSITP